MYARLSYGSPPASGYNMGRVARDSTDLRKAQESLPHTILPFEKALSDASVLEQESHSLSKNIVRLLVAVLKRPSQDCTCVAPRPAECLYVY